MKKASLKKLLAALLVANMALGLAACGSSESNGVSNTGEKEGVAATSENSEVVPTSESEVEEEITFPLEEEMTFDIMVRYDGDIAAEMEENRLWQELYEKTNVKINFIALPKENTMGTLNALFAAEQEGDAILGGGIINESDLSLMAANGLLLPLNEYVEDAELMVNLNERVFSESPETKGVITSTDGNIYSLPKYTALEGNYLESPIWINKTWVEQLGKSVDDIKTIEDLEEVLLAFAENDMNGNGDATDEIPYCVKSSDSFRHIEAILGLWGIATKDNANDNYVYVEDGVVTFAPTTDAYKDALTTLNRWYESGIIWSEVFTGTDETFNSKFKSEVPVVGMYTGRYTYTGLEEHMVQLLPVSVEGYETNWFKHPGLLGVKGTFSVTRSCENPEVLMKWIDQFYTLENSWRALNNESDYNNWKLVDGKYSWYEQTAEQKEFNKTQEWPSAVDGLLGNTPGAFTAADYKDRVVLGKYDQVYQDSFDLYREYLTDEIWPRPYIASDDVTRLAELRTDIFNTVATKRAEWITGVGDINAEWDDFVAEMERVGIDEFVEILQRNYDVFKEGMN